MVSWEKIPGARHSYTRWGSKKFRDNAKKDETSDQYLDGNKKAGREEEKMPYRIYTSRMAHRTLLGHKSTEMALGGLILTVSTWMYFAFRSTTVIKLWLR